MHTLRRPPWRHQASHRQSLRLLRHRSPAALESRGPDRAGNDTWIRAAAAEARTTNGFVVAAWGTHARADRVRAVTEMLASTTTIYCLGTTQSGAPRHPLYLPNDTPLQTWPQ